MTSHDDVASGSVLHRLETMLARVPGERVSIGTVVDGLNGSSAWGFCFLLFGIAGLVPGTAPAFGLALCVIAAGMVLGQRRPWLPDRLRRWQAGRDQLHAGLRRVRPILDWAETRLGQRPRTLRLSPAVMRLAAVAVLINAVLVVLPIPFGNTAPTVAILVLALGLIVDNGVALVAGLVLSLAALAIDGVLVWVGWQAVLAFVSWLV